MQRIEVLRNTYKDGKAWCADRDVRRALDELMAGVEDRESHINRVRAALPEDGGTG